MHKNDWCSIDFIEHSKMSSDDLDPLDPDAVKYDLLNKIHQSGDKLRVGNEIVTIQAPSAIIDSPEPSFDLFESDVPQVYQTTVIKDVGKLIDAAYAYRPSGKVLVIAELYDHETTISRDPIFGQSLLQFVITPRETTQWFLVKDLPIFLNSEAKYIPPRNVDVAVAYTTNYRNMAVDDFRKLLDGSIIDVASKYDYVVLDDSWNIGTIIHEYVEQHPGVVRCVLRP